MKNKKHPLSVVRRVIAALSLLAVTLLLLDLSGVLHRYLGWMAKIQLLPAVLAANFVVIAALVVLTLVFGRVYCSVICPLGIFQDVVSRLRGKKQRFGYSKEVKWLRYGVWVLFVLALVLGVHALVALLAPYSAYGRIAVNIFKPFYIWGNNALAALDARLGWYAFYPKEVWVKSLPTLIVAVATLVAVVILAWKNGRTYCNTICPVGTTLSFFSRFAMFRPVIDTQKCKNCRMCEKSCKAACIDVASHKIDYSRCVDCFDCLDSCKFGALKYRFAWTGKDSKQTDSPDRGRRAFMTTSALLAGALTVEAQEKKLDGGLADIVNKVEPERTGRLVPFGAVSPKHFYDHCTACGLCIANCPNRVLRPSSDLEHLMQPYMSFEKGYCRPECTTCSQVCPAGAILPITPEEKTQIHIGIAVVDYDLCLVNADGVSCGNCARHCPVHAIHMVPADPENPKGPRIPSVKAEACIGCGACENLCPSGPFSAIHVNGRKIHIDNRNNG